MMHLVHVIVNKTDWIKNIYDGLEQQEREISTILDVN